MTPLRVRMKVGHVSYLRRFDTYGIFGHRWCNHSPMSSNNIRPSLSVSPLRAHWHVHESHVQFSWPRQHRCTSIVSGLYFSCREYLRLGRISWLTFSRVSCCYHWLILGTANFWHISGCHNTKGSRLALPECKHNGLVILGLLAWLVESLHWHLPWIWWLRLLIWSISFFMNSW